MGYFSNGTEGRAYEYDYCRRCVHNQQEAYCPVWTLQMLHNGEEWTHVLIPRTEDKLGNEQCRMFVAAVTESGDL